MNPVIKSTWLLPEEPNDSLNSVFELSENILRYVFVHHEVKHF